MNTPYSQTNRRWLRWASCFVASVGLARAIDLSEEGQPKRAPHGALSSVTANRDAPRPPAAAKAAASLPTVVDGYTVVGFDQLAGFAFEVPALQAEESAAKAPPPEVLKQVPEAIRKLDGQKVMVTGFMLPQKLEKGLVTEFLLLNSPSLCCFGITPATNAWIAVKVPAGVPATPDVPCRFFGRLRVQAQWENGWLASIYQLEGEAVPARKR